MKLRSGVLLGFVLTFALVACGAGPAASPTGSSTTTAGVTPSTTPNAPSATPTPTTPASAPDLNAIAIGKVMSVDLPTGWQIIRQINDAGSDGSVCLHPAGDTKTVFGCAGVEIDYGKHLPGAHTDPYAADRPDGWYRATDVEPCPYAPAQVKGQVNGIETKAGLSNGLRPVGAHKADWNRWTATCASGPIFHPQPWFLPKSHVVIFDYIGHPEVAAMLASAKFAADGDALPTMPEYVFGHLASANGSAVTFQVFKTYTTGVEGKAYAKAHHLDYPFPDDYYDADNGTLRSFAYDASTGCTGNEIVVGTSEDTSVACSKFASHIGMPIAAWILPGATTAQSIGEVFRP